MPAAPLPAASLPVDFAASAPALARALIGVRLLVDGVGGTIVETEAYDQAEPAAHTHRGRNPRNAVMFGAPGHAYVYRSYGRHWCLNFVCGPIDHGAGVLIRALAPEDGIDLMRARRGPLADRLLCAGPGRVAQALGITGAHNGKALDAPPFRLLAATGALPIVQGRRIGITRAVDLPWRFGLAGSVYLSRPFAPTVRATRAASGVGQGAARPAEK